MKKILILGATSYVGTSFHKYINDKYPDYEVAVTSLRDGNNWQDEDWSGYDLIYNVTGKAHSDISRMNDEAVKEYYHVNCELAAAAYRKAIESKAGMYVYMSSIIVYGDSALTSKDIVITPQTEESPSNFYGDSKLKAEKELSRIRKESDGSCALVVIRAPMIYGEGCKGNYATLRKFAGRFKFFPEYHNERSILSINRLCAEILRIMESGAEGIYFIQDERTYSTGEMISEIADKMGRNVRLCKWINPFVDLGKHLPGKVGSLFRKAFGTLVINGDYRELS